MSIPQIHPDGGINPLKDPNLQQPSRTVKGEAHENAKKVEGDSVELSEEARLYQEISKFKKELEHIPSPNEGRIEELKAAIQSGTLFDEKVINEVAGRIADQLFGV